MQEIIEKLKKFRDERNWEQFHNNKDLAIALNIETSELLELFLWKNTKEVDKEELKEELADILSYALLIADKNKLDIKEIILDKIAKNAKKYPIDKAKNTANKYNKL
ncbi:nucleotide pyrophosphohydrolase [Bacteroidota bacterium]|nr:nucleotide pyrophosphohydrolase [Bacteroidota bacterium]